MVVDTSKLRIRKVFISGMQEESLARACERRTHLDGTVQSAIVDALEFVLDGGQIDLRAGNQHSDEGGVVSSHSVHGLKQTVGKKGGRRLDALNCSRNGGKMACI